MTAAHFNDGMTIAEARDILRALALEDGHDCPVCRQRCKVYQRPMTSVAARAVAALFREHETNFGEMRLVVRRHLPDVANQGGYLILAQHWGLIEEQRGVRGARTGLWRVTSLGVAWLRGEITVPKYVRIFDGRRLGQPFGEAVSSRAVLGEHFDIAIVRAPAPVPDGQPADDLFSQAA